MVTKGRIFFRTSLFFCKADFRSVNPRYSVDRVACVAWRFWLGALSNKGGRGQRNREEIGAGAT